MTAPRATLHGVVFDILAGSEQRVGFPAFKINRIPFKLACPFLPTMMWSCTEMPSGAAMSMMALVIWMSACEGVGSPEGWLCINTLEGRISFRSKLLVIS